MDSSSKTINNTNIVFDDFDNIISSLKSQVTLLKERLSQEREEHKEIYAKQKQEIEILKEKFTFFFKNNQ
tara:strand:+ start:318 stop:527 length:210 start_codon:yes stop_codon:yes gene_type:complete